MFLKCFGESSSSGRQYPTVIEELCTHFSLDDLRKSTTNFDDKRVIRSEGCGIVYKGCLQYNDGSDYAVEVKRFNVLNSKEFKKQVELLCQLHHPNCMSIVGFSNHKKWSFVVYEYMSNESLDHHLSGKVREALSWKKRVEICIGAARGLHYLHAGLKRTIIHRHIHPSNILLDDNMHPKVSGFDYSILGAHFKEKPKPIKSNIIGEPLEKNCVEENIDPKIKGKIAPECWKVFIDITLRCLQSEPDERPTMGEVEVELELALLLQEQADVTNINSDYTLLSKTTIIPKSDWRFEYVID
ncbi:receptor-like protein kinase FERONIA isoform X2 [Phaseolus vulgaris]|uniref:receptor-like protein kinase FERONIA isoform X2 n=1 Tax=Phaseolus vulgaris TaxID=3885 RepID=UPI0035CAE03A